RAGKGRVEGVEEAVHRKQVAAVPGAYGAQGGDGDFGREGDGSARRGGGDGAVVLDLGERGAAREVSVVGRRVGGAVRGGEAPHVRAKTRPAARVRDRVRALGVGGAPRVLEVVDALRPHEAVLNGAKIDPHVRVLVAEQGREAEIRLPAEGPPIVG